MNAPSAPDRIGHKRAGRFRFILRTLFALVTVVAVCVGLLLHNGFFAGYFYSFMFCAGAFSLHQRFREGVVACVLLAAAFWLMLQFFGPYTTLRHRVIWSVGTDRLQEWAVETLDAAPPDANEAIWIDKKDLPKDIQTVVMRGCEIVPASGAQDAHIYIPHGGAWYHWGLEIGRPGFVPRRSPSSPMHRRIADGVWGYHER